MDDQLDITKLIEITQDLVHDGRINMAERGEIKVQDIIIGNHIYDLSVVLKLKIKPGNSVKN